MRSFRFGLLYPVASTVSLLAFCACDVVRLPPSGHTAAVFVAELALLALCIGAAHGLGWALLMAASSRLAPRLRGVVWFGVTMAGAALFSSALGAFERLTGRYHWEAFGVVAASIITACALTAVVLAVHEAGQHAAGFLMTAPPRLHRAGVATLLVCSVAIYIVDATFYAHLYPLAHYVLRLLGWWFGMFTLVLASRDFVWPRWPLVVCLAPFAAGLTLGLVSDPAYRIEAFLARPWPALVLQAARVLTDVDGDGYSALFGGGDCQAWNPRVHPGAREIPDNGIDDNCILGDASRHATVVERLALPAQPSPMDIVLLTSDALRPDHIGAYNPSYGAKGRATTPAIDHFAQSAVIFDRAYSPGGGTNVALGSLLRGLYPRRLRWTTYFETDAFLFVRKRAWVSPGQTVVTMFPLSYDDPHLPLPAQLLRRGMYTIAALDDGYSEMLSRGTGIESGFSMFLETDQRPLSEQDDAGTATAALRALHMAPHDRRIFLWAHFFGTHSPNSPHPGAHNYGNSLADGYDHEINYFDMQVGRLLRELEHWPRPVAVFIAADHGDVMANGRYHGYTLADDVVRVPLIARVPGWSPRHVAEPVSLVDLLPTILELTNTPAPTYLDGISLSSYALHPEVKHNRTLFSDSWLYTAAATRRVDLTAAYDDTGKVIIDHLTQARYQEYDLSPDQERDEIQRLGHALDAYSEETGGALQLRP